MNGLGKRVLALLLFQILVLHGLDDRVSAHEPLFPFRQVSDEGALAGYMDRNGTVRIRPQFEMALPFANDRAIVMVRDRTQLKRYAYIDHTGKFAIPERFWKAYTFHENRAAVIRDPPERLFQYPKIGFIDPQGHFRVKPQFDTAEPFHNGVALVGNVNALGKWYSLAAENHEGFVDYTYVDRNGNMLGSRAFDYDWDTHGLLPMKPKGWVQLWGFVDSTGKFVISARFRKAHRFVDDLACVQTAFGKWGYLSRDGEWGIRPVFPQAFSFAEGLAAAQSPSTGQFGFINAKGKWSISPVFTSVFDFSEGLAYAKDSGTGKGGYINKRGTFVIQPKYDYGRQFTNELAIVDLGRKEIYVDRQGLVIRPFEERTQVLQKDGAPPRETGRKNDR